MKQQLLDFIYFVKENFRNSENANDSMCYYKKNNINEIEFSYSITFDSPCKEIVFRFIVLSEKVKPKMCITIVDTITYENIESILNQWSSMGMFINYKCLDMRKRALEEFSNKYINVTEFKTPV